MIITIILVTISLAWGIYEISKEWSNLTFRYNSAKNNTLAKDVYYDPTYCAFFQIHVKEGKNLIIGDYARYFVDAQTNILRYKVEKNILKRCRKITDVSKVSDIAFYDGIGWRTRNDDIVMGLYKNPEFEYLGTTK